MVAEAYARAVRAAEATEAVARERSLGKRARRSAEEAERRPPQGLRAIPPHICARCIVRGLPRRAAVPLVVKQWDFQCGGPGTCRGEHCGQHRGSQCKVACHGEVVKPCSKTHSTGASTVHWNSYTPMLRIVVLASMAAITQGGCAQVATPCVIRYSTVACRRITSSVSQALLFALFCDLFCVHSCKRGTCSLVPHTPSLTRCSDDRCNSHTLYAAHAPIRTRSVRSAERRGDRRWPRHRHHHRGCLCGCLLRRVPGQDRLQGLDVPRLHEGLLVRTADEKKKRDIHPCASVLLQGAHPAALTHFIPFSPGTTTLPTTAYPKREPPRASPPARCPPPRRTPHPWVSPAALTRAPRERTGPSTPKQRTRKRWDEPKPTL